MPRGWSRAVGLLMPALLPVLLAGCEDNNPFPKDHCTLASIGDMDVVTARGSPVIPVTLDGHKAAMTVDTGAAFSALSGSIAERFQLPQTMTKQIVGGIDGTAFASVATIESLGVGIGSIHNISLTVTPAAMDRTIDGLPMAGLFGGDFLYNYDVYFDLPDRQFSFYREFNCPKEKDIDLGWPNGFYVVPFEEGRPGRYGDVTKISMPIAVDGHRITVVLDSGAFRTLISLDDAHALGVTDAMLAADHHFTVNGIIGTGRDAWVHRFASVDIGPEHFTDTPMVVIDSDTPSLLGADFIRTHRMLISYRRDSIFIERHAHPVPPSPALEQVAGAQPPAGATSPPAPR